MNARALSAGGRVGRAILLEGQPDLASGEITDKGYLNQAMARARRPEALARLFAAVPDPEVLVL
jgi:feruloyl-CoA synthase